MKCPHCGCEDSFRNDVEDPTMETCCECGAEFYPSDSEEKYQKGD